VQVGNFAAGQPEHIDQNLVRTLAQERGAPHGQSRHSGEIERRSRHQISSDARMQARAEIRGSPVASPSEDFAE
jgi:hypothetical protein